LDGRASCSRRSRSEIVVHLPNAEATVERAAELEEAFHHYFTYRAEVLDREFKELMRVCRLSLMVGLTILATCLVVSHLGSVYLAGTPFDTLVEESFLILGWVANWRPLEIFLYDWWPLARRRRLYRRLAAAEVGGQILRAVRGCTAIELYQEMSDSIEYNSNFFGIKFLWHLRG
jgi:hypothetical protein